MRQGHNYNILCLFPLPIAWSDTYTAHNLKTSTMALTVGAYFRLFAGEVLPSTVETVVYIDTDTVLLSSLDGIWKHHLLNETVSTTSGYDHRYSSTGARNSVPPS